MPPASASLLAADAKLDDTAPNVDAALWGASLSALAIAAKLALEAEANTLDRDAATAPSTELDNELAESSAVESEDAIEAGAELDALDTAAGELNNGTLRSGRPHPPDRGGPLGKTEVSAGGLITCCRQSQT
jgi:hypothetical protein